MILLSKITGADTKKEEHGQLFCPMFFLKTVPGGRPVTFKKDGFLCFCLRVYQKEMILGIFQCGNHRPL